MENEKMQCYNRGCGQKFTLEDNKDDSCCHHPGLPFFHDAYKGWSCCNKKCTDFTEFLNIKGCSKSKHSNIKPPEPEKPEKEEVDINEVIEVKPIVPKYLVRPPFDSPLTKKEPEIAPSLRQQVFSDPTTVIVNKNPDEIAIGTLCKNRGCTTSYEGPETTHKTCVYHPGVPIFHEGLKYWSCCQKKTTEFEIFCAQVGCEKGKHVWIKTEDIDGQTVRCRWDFHQTPSHVILAIYAKQYCVKTSTVFLNPIRLKTSLVFPLQGGARFDLDVELKGIIDVASSQVSFFGTKVEIKLKKAEAGTWTTLEIPTAIVEKPTKKLEVSELTPQIKAVDLDDL